uniref:TIR domain-containing protein n=1 Tax=Salix viminalis TaxID=40686 RepID=A0A6N2KED8_SALVM
MAKDNNLIDKSIEFLVGLQVSILEMQKEKRKQSNDEEDDSSSRKRRKADLSKPVSFISTVFAATMIEPESSRSRPKGAYDVFLSFRGEDNRKNFTDHLYTALVQAGVHTFLDENEIPKGEEISKHLLKENWPDCSSYIYDIDPSDVRKQTGDFAKAFDKHEECFKEKVKEWRKALEEVGNLSGWNLNDMENRHESKFIQVIIKDVLNKLDPKYINVATNLVSIDRLVQTISDFLSTTTNEGSCFLLNINETSEQSNGLNLLQEQLLHDILKQNATTINNIDRGMVLIKERLCHKRVIVVIDDVAQQYQAKCFGGRAKLVEELKRDASLQLFSWHAFRDNKPSKDYIELSNDVVDYCGGIPLALEVLGSSLSMKNKSRWKCVIDKLRIIPNHDIQEKLRVCFDKLDDHKLQKTFLDLACFFIGRNKEYVSNILEARCGYNPEDDLGTLSERSLIKVNAFGEISMHNLLRDMGREIIHRESPDHPGKRSRIWQREDAWNVLSKQMKLLEGLALDVRASKNKLLSTRSFTKMRCLKLLLINGVHLSGPFKLLSEELIWICWLECPLKSLPFDLMLDNLVVLEMQYSNIKELWKEKKILNKLKILNLSYSKHLVKTPNLHSSSLEKLLMEGCLSLVEVHQSVGHLKSLIFLNLKGCRRLKTIPQSICDAKSLQILNISECSQLEKLPEHMGGMESFIELLADGINNEQLLASIEHLKYLRKLSLCGYNFNADAPSSTSWPSPISFDCSRGIESIRQSQSAFKHQVLPKLQLLRVSHCRNLVSISELPSNLKLLDAIGCKSMERVRLPIQSKNNSNLSLHRCSSNHGWIISSNTACDSSNNSKNLVEASYNHCYGYNINDYDARLLMSLFFSKYPNGFSYHAEGCSLSFHIPPTFQGLFFWAFGTRMFFSSSHIIKGIIRKKSNGMQLFEATQVVGLYCPLSWSRYVSLSEIGMEEYCGHEELELYVNLGSADINVKQCGIQVIVDLDSLEAIEWDPDIEMENVIPSPTSHLLYHPLYGSISFNTIENWKANLIRRKILLL